MSWTEEDRLRYERKLLLQWAVAGLCIWVVTVTALILVDPEATWLTRFIVGCIMGVGGGCIGSGLANALHITWRLRKLQS